MNKRPSKPNQDRAAAPRVPAPAEKGFECDEPLPHIKQEESEAAAAENINLPESHIYNDPDAPEMATDKRARGSRAPGWRAASANGSDDPPSRPLVT